MQQALTTRRRRRACTSALLCLAALTSLSIGCSSSEFALADGFGASASGYSSDGLTGDESETDGDSETDSDSSAGGDEAGTDNIGECDPFLQDCDGEFKCGWVQTPEGPVTACVPEPETPTPDGGACGVATVDDPTDSCEPGSYCGFGDSYGDGICTPLCQGSLNDPSCEDDGAICRACEDCPSVCLSVCDPLGIPCGEGLVCAAAMQLGAFVCTMDASTDNGGKLNDSCEFANECGPGLACVPGEDLVDCDSGNCCAPYCDTQAPATCDETTYCTPWPFQGTLPSFEYVGVCTSTMPRGTP